MLNWIEQQIQQQRFEEMVRTAQRDRLAQLVLAAKPQRAHFYSPILAGLGRWLEAWGYRLQRRYGAVPEVTIATKTPISRSR
ncbi:MAG TPA: hypothetical protein VKE41_05575 [Roseiflexaceae bacterium]|nr:hypothetical protein [Roseiflexaceae bacterium]